MTSDQFVKEAWALWSKRIATLPPFVAVLQTGHELSSSSARVNLMLRCVIGTFTPIVSDRISSLEFRNCRFWRDNGEDKAQTELAGMSAIAAEMDSFIAQFIADCRRANQALIAQFARERNLFPARKRMHVFRHSRERAGMKEIQSGIVASTNMPKSA